MIGDAACRIGCFICIELEERLSMSKDYVSWDRHSLVCGVRDVNLLRMGQQRGAIGYGPLKGYY